jgi:hypothetical protein
MPCNRHTKRFAISGATQIPDSATSSVMKDYPSIYPCGLALRARFLRALTLTFFADQLANASSYTGRDPTLAEFSHAFATSVEDEIGHGNTGGSLDDAGFLPELEQLD